MDIVSLVLPDLHKTTRVTSPMISFPTTSKKRSRGWAEWAGIPPIVWQTYITKDLKGRAAVCRESWLRLNTQWDHTILDDGEIDSMMEAEFASDVVQAFRGFPLGVMRADMWRYAILLRYGGLYADVDCRCEMPVNHWSLPGIEALRESKKPALIVALENKVHFCNWTFAASPGHPVLQRVLDLIVERFQKGIDYSNEHFVHEHSGPAVWTDAIREIMEVDATPGEIANSADYRRKAMEQGIYILDVEAFRGRFCINEYGSTNFVDHWSSWTQQRAELITL